MYPVDWSQILTKAKKGDSPESSSDNDMMTEHSI